MTDRPHQSPSNFVERAMELASEISVASYMGGGCDWETEELRTHLTAREALLEQMAEALRELLAAGDAYADPAAAMADDVRLMVRFGQADEEARAALNAYQDTK